MNALASLYARKIKEGTRTLDSVPDRLREQVELALEKLEMESE